MNATRAATIRLRSSFDGAVSSAACRPRRWRSWRAASRRSATSSPSPTGSSTRASWPFRRSRGGPTKAASTPGRIRESGAEQEATRSSRPARANRNDHQGRKAREQGPGAAALRPTSLQRDAKSSRFGFTARRTLGAAQRLYEEHKALTYPRTNSRLHHQRHDPGRSSRSLSSWAVRRSTRRRPITSPASMCCRSGGSSTTRRSPTTTRSSRPSPSATRSTRWTMTTGASTTSSCAGSWRSSTRRRSSRTRASRRPSPSYVFRTRGKLLLVPGWRGVYGEGVRPTRRGEPRRRR